MDQIDKLILQVEGEEKLRKATIALSDQREEVDKLVKALNGMPAASASNYQQIRQEIALLKDRKDEVDRLTRSTRDMGQAALQSSYALQDFAQNGLGGILNNIPNIVSSLGGGAGLAGVMAALGVAVWALKDPMTEFASWVNSGANAVPKVRDAVASMDDELKIAKDRLKELGEG